MHEAFAVALSVWPRSGVPATATLVDFDGRFKAIDALRRRARWDASRDELLRDLEAHGARGKDPEELTAVDSLEDDRLRLIFTCCHPSLAPEARVCAHLREVCGLTTEEIAKAFLIPPSTLAQRIVRAKAKIRRRRFRMRCRCRGAAGAAGRGAAGYLSRLQRRILCRGGSGGHAGELTGEAIRLGRLLMELQPEPEVLGLLSLMLLQESRHAARTSPSGELILLENQNRLLWNRSRSRREWYCWRNP